MNVNADCSSFCSTSVSNLDNTVLAEIPVATLQNLVENLPGWVEVIKIGMLDYIWNMSVYTNVWI